MSDLQNYVYVDQTSGSILLNAGLPWTNPLKIQIGSDEHILDTTINRGLMMLLNNDYYLDAKATVLSKELSSVIANVDVVRDVLSSHINDWNIHGKKQLSTLVQNITYQTLGDSKVSIFNDDKLQGDTIKYLPINYTAAQLNDIIKNTPHNLNTYNLIFLFVVPDDYPENVTDYICEINDGSIEFNNFYNGSLYVLGDYLHEKEPPHKLNVNRKSKEKINDPIRYDSINLKKYLTNLKNEIDKPEDINDIVSSEDENSLYHDYLKKIKIRGTALNENYSVITFKDIQAKTFVKNLSFVSALEEDSLKKNTLIIKGFNNRSHLPTNERLALFYPLEKDLVPEIGYALRNQINTVENKDNFGVIGVINDSIYSAINMLSGTVYSESGLLSQFDSQIEVLQNEHEKDYLLTSSQIVKMKNKFAETSSLFMDLETAMTNSDISAFIADGQFRNDEFVSNLMSYQKAMYTFNDEVSSLFDYSNLQAFIVDKPDIMNGAIEYTSSTFLEYKDMYLNPVLNTVLSAITSSNMVFGDLVNYLDTIEAEDFILTDNVDDREYPSGTYTNDFEKYVEFGNIDHGCTAIKWDNGDGSAFLAPDNRKLNRFLFNLLFKKQIFDGIKETHNSSEIFPFNSSKKGATICLWVRLPEEIGTMTRDDIGIMNFTLKHNTETDVMKQLKLNFNWYSANANINNVNSTIMTLEANDDSVGKLGRGEWIMLQYKIDNNEASDAINPSGLAITENIFKYVENASGDPEIEKIPLSTVYISPNADFDFNAEFADYQMDIGVGNNKSFIGNMRNLMFFVGSLTDNESFALFEQGIKKAYDLPAENTTSALAELIKSKQFYLGLIGVYSVDNINILNCVMKYKGKSYLVK